MSIITFEIKNGKVTGIEHTFSFADIRILLIYLLKNYMENSVTPGIYCNFQIAERIIDKLYTKLRNIEEEEIIESLADKIFEKNEKS